MQPMRLRLLVLVALLAAPTPAFAAPFDIFVSLDPGQTGPLYEWSLGIDVEDGYAFGAIQLIVTGFDTFAINSANPRISELDTAFVPNSLGPGHVLILVNTANGVAIETGPVSGALLGTFTSAFAEPSAIGVFNCDADCGATVIDPSLTQVLPDYSIRVVGAAPIPEPRYLGFLSLIVAAATIARVCRSRSPGVTRRA